MPEQAPTFESIALAAQVSKATVSLALRESPKVKEETRKKIQKVASELGYRPNPLVSAQMSHIRSRKKRKTITTIGFLNTWYDEKSGERLKWNIIGRFADGARERAESLGYNFQGMQNLLTELISRGYKRIGFITDLEDESRGGHCWIGSFLDYQFRKIPAKDQIPILNFSVCESEMTPNDYAKMIDWIETNKPDVVLSFRDGFLKFFENNGYDIPKDFGYAALCLNSEMKDCAGFIQNLENIGSTTVDIIVERLYCNERGALPEPKITLIGGKFLEGSTIEAKRKDLSST